MNTQRAKILLEKVNALFKSMSVDEANITAIEKDLMLSYLRQLYDSVLENSSSTTSTSTPSSTRKASPRASSTEKPTYKPPRIIEIPDSLKEDIEKPVVKTKKKKSKSKSKNTSKPPRIITPPKLDPIPATPKPTYTPPVVETPAPTPPPPKPQPKPTPPPPPQPKPKPVSSGKHQQLFEFKAARELSEKLSQRPIRDLTKAFSLNDKLLYANELFGKELVVFNEEVRKINGLKNFDDAKQHLAHLADKFNWSSKSKVPMAKDFVLLVKRRFS